MELISKLDSTQQHTWTIAWHPNGNLIACGGSDRKIILWSTNPLLSSFNKNQMVSGDSRKSVRSLAFSPDGKMLCAGSFDSTISVYVWSGGQYNHLSKLQGHENEVKCVNWSPNGTKIASCSRDRNIFVWRWDEKAEDFLCENILEGHTQDVKWVEWLTQDCMVSSSYDNTIKVWEYEDDQVVCRQTLEGHASTVWSVRVHKESKRLVSVSDDCLVKVWGKEGSIYKPIQTVEGLHTREIYTCDFNIQQNLIATGSADNKIIISKFTDGLVGEVVITQVNNVKMQIAHQGDVNSIKFHPKDSQVLASCGDDGFVKVWRLPQI